MFPIKRIKKEVSDEVDELGVLSNEDIKIEVKVEEVELLDNNCLNADKKNVGIHGSDFESVYGKDKFDSKIMKRELENNEEIINRPVIINTDNPQVELSDLSKDIVSVPKAYLEMKLKTETEKEKSNSPLSLEERERLKLKNIMLTVEMTSLKRNNTRLWRSLQNSKKYIALLEHREKLADTKLLKANIARKRLQNKIEELQTHVNLLSEQNSKLEKKLESLQGKSDKKRKKVAIELINFNEKVERTNGEMLTENNEFSLEVLKETIISLVKEKSFVEGQLDRKTAELKKTQEKYGNTIIALSVERRKTQELVKNMNSTEKERPEPLVWSLRK